MYVREMALKLRAPATQVQIPAPTQRARHLTTPVTPAPSGTQTQTGGSLGLAGQTVKPRFRERPAETGRKG